MVTAARGAQARELCSALERGRGDKGFGNRGWESRPPSLHALLSVPAIKVVIGRGTAAPPYSEDNQWVFNFQTITLLSNLNFMCFWNPESVAAPPSAPLSVQTREHGTQNSDVHRGAGVDGTAAPPGGGPSSRPGWPADGPAPEPAEESDGRDGCRRPSLKATAASRLSRAEAHSATDPERLDLGPIFVQAVPLPSPPSELLWGTAGRKLVPTHWPLPRSPPDPLPLLTGARVSLGLVMGVRGRWTQSPGSGLGFSSKHPCSLDPSIKGTRRSRPGWLRGLGGWGQLPLAVWGAVVQGWTWAWGWAHCGLCSPSSPSPATWPPCLHFGGLACPSGF